MFERLGPGESVVLLGGRAFRVRLPMVNPPESLRYQRLRYRKPSVVGLNLVERFETEFSLLNSRVEKAHLGNKSGGASEAVVSELVH